MKKVANCFKSLGNVTRARAIFNGVMSKNSCRVVLIALLMFVCGSGSMFAQNIDDYLNDGDIVSLRIGDRYLIPVGANNPDKNKVNTNQSRSNNCLWVLHIDKNTKNFTLQALGTDNYLRVYDTWQYKLVINAAGSASTFSFYNNYTPSGVEGKRVTARISSGNRRIQIGNQNEYGGDIFRTTSGNGSDVVIEKWTHVKNDGGIQFTVNPTPVSFTEFTDGTAENPVPGSKTVKITMKREQAQEYYENQNDTDQKITITTATGSTELPNISNVSAAWESNNNNNAFSSAKCQVYGSDVVSDRQLMQITSCTPTDDDKKTECTVTVAAIGNSPMEMKTEDGKWKDHSDVLIVTFRDTEKDATYRARVNVTRRSFHAEKLPEFVVEADQGSILFNKVGGNATVNITCTHQHGTGIWHKTYDHGDEEVSTKITDIYTVAPTTITDLSGIATFSPKSVSDETNVNWITLSSSSTPGQAIPGPADGKLTLAAEANTTAIARSARLVGVFNYTCSANSANTHTAFLQIPISQNAKDGKTKFHHQKGHYNTEFGKNPYTLEDEQLVHTVERTIYYVHDQDISLNLQEKRFQGYKRWYDYETQDDPRYNAEEADRTSWATNGAPSGTLIGAQDDYGDTYGVYSTGNTDNNIPVIKGWKNGAAHIIACDVSNYKDYDIDNPAEITEPTLSYRQLWHLRPASEIAGKFAALSAGQYLETHYYTAPTGKTIYLASNFNHSVATESDNCYFYYNKEGKLTRVNKNVKWYEDNNEIATGTYAIKDYRAVSSTTERTVTYDLRVPGVLKDGKDLLIARFVVTYVNPATHGPSTKEIISREQILSKYVLLEEVNFNFDPAPGTTDANKQLYHTLPWIESTYGYYYPNGVLGGDDKYHRHSNRSGNNIPYTGEYFLVNGLSLEWADQDNRGGAENGYVLYVDGSQEPGLVASISTSATICSGQTLYCSMWLCNPSRNRGTGSFADPIFRCNIQGRNAGDADWTDVGVYFVGDLPWGPDNRTGGSWHQVNFPVVSEVNYDETRVQIYNFGTGESGNDFMVDDIRLYASPLPLAAYHATTGCQSYTEEETTNTVVVLRIDYDYLNEDLKGENKHVYYEVFNETDSVIVQLKEKVGDVYQSVYYQDDKNNVSPDYGSILIPPTREGSGVPEKSDITSYINELTPQKGEKSKSGKCFVKDSGGKWFLYLIHVIPTGNSISGTDANVYLDRNKSYILRIAHQPGDLHKAACVFTTQLHATQDTYVQLHNDEVDSLRITSCLANLCANNHHFLTVKVQNTIMPTIGGEMKTIAAQVHADWLTGFAFDDIYCNESAITSVAQKTANAAFTAKYGYGRDTIENAIAAMRNTAPDNPNYQVDNAKDLQVLDGHLTQEQRDLIVDLCNRGLLLLYQKTKMFYLGSEATARYWVYPVAEDAEVIYEGTPYTLHDCNEPKWVKLTSVKSDYGVNLSPIKGEHQDEQQKLDIASIRILEGTQKVVIPVKELIKSTQLSSQLTANTNTIRFQYNDPTIKDVVQYVDLSKNRVDIIDPPATLEPGKDYLMRMAFYDELGRPYIGGSLDSCRVGYIYFYLSIVPKTVQWTGEASPIWGDDKNWKGVKEDGSLMDVGFAPLPETSVIIRPLPEDKPYPIVTEDDHYPMDVNHIPNTCDKIYLASGTTIYNQHLLQYNKAFVDMQVPATAWNTMAAPMQGMYTGDMFIPHNKSDFSGKNLESKEPFVVNGFEGSRVSSAPFAFWQSFYNKRVTIYHENGNTSSAMSSNTAAFAQTNSLSQKLEPGTGFQVLAYGPTNKKDETLIVRLPKPDTEYTYFNTNGSESWQKVSVEHSSKLAFTPSAGGEMVINLTNATASNQFMFGNPTMTKIDMAKFIADNPAIKSYSTMVDGTWNAENEFTMVGAPGLLAPMRSVLLNLEEGNTKTSLQLVLKTSHLVGYTAYNTPSEEPETIAPRKNSAEASDETMLMTVYATSNKGQARCMVVANGGAKDTYDSNEDVLFFSSGVEEGVNSATATSPVNMYTVSEQVPMMVDVREKIDTVPLSMLVHKSYRTEKVKFSFYLSLNWDKECYFCDAVTGERYRILDGLVLEMDMPQNHEVRYFIDGPDVIDPDNGGDIWSSTEDVKTSTNQVWAYSPSQGQLVVASNDIIKAVMVYDIAGRLIGYRELEMQYNSTTFDTPTGACIVKAVLRDNTEHYISALVK